MMLIIIIIVISYLLYYFIAFDKSVPQYFQLSFCCHIVCSVLPMFTHLFQWFL